MRILFLTQWFDPEPDFKGLIFAKELQALGHEVQVLTGFPNYPGGKVYPGYKIRLIYREVLDGIRVARVPLLPSHSQSVIGRIANYLSFALSAACLGALLMPQPDVMYVYHPPATVGIAALALRLLRGIPFVYDVNDLWPDTLAATGMIRGRFPLRAIDLWCSGLYRLAARIVVVTPGFKERLLERGVPGHKIEVIFNWGDEKILATPAPAAVRLEEGKFNVVFAGNMGPAQGLDTVLQCAQILQLRTQEAKFVLVGAGIDLDRLKSIALERKLENVQFIPRQPREQVGAILSAADALLVHLRDNPLFEITIPSKTQAYLAIGRPVIMAVRGDAANLIKEAEAGITCHPDDPEALAKAVETLLQLPLSERQNMGDRGRRYYAQRLSLKVGVRKFESVLASCARFR